MGSALRRYRASLARDWPIELVSLLALLYPTVSLLLAWGELPETVPVHFDAAGEPDRFGPKGSLWTLPLVTIGTWLFLSALQLLPVTKLNLPVKVTADNREHVERVSSRAFASFKAVIILTLALLGQLVLRSAGGGDAALPPWFILLVTLGPLPVLVWLVAALRQKPTSPRA